MSALVSVHKLTLNVRLPKTQAILQCRWGNSNGTTLLFSITNNTDQTIQILLRVTNIRVKWYSRLVAKYPTLLVFKRIAQYEIRSLQPVQRPA